MRTLGRILAGAGVGLCAATVLCVSFIIAAEYALARGWVERYDDLTLAYSMQGLLMSGPIVGGWWAWVRRGVSHDTT